MVCWEQQIYLQQLNFLDMENRPENTNRRAILGIFLIVVGAVWVLERLGMIPSFLNDIFISWQMLLIGLGIFISIAGNKTKGIILIVAGAFFLLPEAFHIPYEIRRIGWPLFIILVGIILIMLHSQKKDSTSSHTSFNKKEHQNIDFFEDFVVFGGREVFVDSQNFLGGQTAAVFGSAQYDFRQAQLSSNGAEVQALAVFGSTIFKVPQGWNVKNEVTAIFGAFTDKRGSTLNQINDPSRTLIIKGFALFGGVEIKNM
jgi:predicted membrane protein